MRLTLITLLLLGEMVYGADAPNRPPQVSVASRGSPARPPQISYLGQDGPVRQTNLCPCSLRGICDCGVGSDCGCLSAGKYRWVATDKPNQVALYRGTSQVGNWWVAEQKFMRLIEGDENSYAWRKEECPTAPPILNSKGKVSEVNLAVTQPALLPTYSAPTMRPMETFSLPQRMSFGGGSCGPSG